MNYTVLSRLVQIVLSVLSIKLTTGTLEPEQMGRLALVNSVVAFFAFLLLNPVGMFMNRRMHGWWQSRRWVAYLRLFGLYMAGVSLLAGGIFSAAQSWFGGMELSHYWMFVMVAAPLLISTSNQVLVSTLNLLGFMKPFAVLNVMTPALGLVASIWLCSLFGARAEFWLLGVLVGQGVVAALAALAYRAEWLVAGPQPTVIPPVNKEMILRLTQYSWPIAIAVVLGWFQTQGYRLTLERTVGLQQLGLFVAGYGIAMGVMSAMESLLGSYLQPAFYRRLHISKGDAPALAWNQYVSVALPALTLTAAALVAVAAEASDLLLASAYSNVTAFVIWGSVIELIRTIANSYALAFHAQMDTRSLIKPNLVGALTSMLALYAASSTFGIAAAGPALALAGLIYLGTFHLVVRQLPGIQFPWRRLGAAAAGGALIVGTVAMSREMVPPMGAHLKSWLMLACAGCPYLIIIWPLVRNRSARD
jgi:O-antigen/teichoic acid export membrane protein